MRKIIVLEFVSLGGVIQAPGGPQENASGGFAYGGWTHSQNLCSTDTFEAGRTQMRNLIYAINVTADGCCDHTKQFVDDEQLGYFTQLTREG